MKWSLCSRWCDWANATRYKSIYMSSGFVWFSHPWLFHVRGLVWGILHNSPLQVIQPTTLSFSLIIQLIIRICFTWIVLYNNIEIRKLCPTRSFSVIRGRNAGCFLRLSNGGLTSVKWRYVWVLIFQPIFISNYFLKDTKIHYSLWYYYRIKITIYSIPLWGSLDIS